MLSIWTSLKFCPLIKTVRSLYNGYHSLAYKYILSHISGGLKAVIYTDTLQTVIMVIGAFILMGISE